MPQAQKSRHILRRIGRVALGVSAVGVIAALAAGTVALALLGDTVKSFLGTDVVDVTAEERDAVMATGRALAERIEAEGVVLVRNEDDALPLPASADRVNVFGWASTQWVGSGSGSGQVAGSVMGLLDALDERGVAYNHELSDMYRDSTASGTTRAPVPSTATMTSSAVSMSRASTTGPATPRTFSNARGSSPKRRSSSSAASRGSRSTARPGSIRCVTATARS